MAISTINQNGLNAPLTLTSPVLTTPNLGTPSALVLTNATGLPRTAMPVGSVIQTVGGSDVNTYTSTSTTPSVTSSMSITLTSASSQVAVFFWIYGAGTIGSIVPGIDVYLYRGGSSIGNRTRLYCVTTSSGSPTDIGGGIPMMYLDTPGTTSPNYQIAIAKTSGAGTSQSTQTWAYWVIQEIKV